MGRRKAAVLPLPVDAHARRSLPSIAGGIASDWIGVGRAKPISRIPFRMLGSSLNFEKFTLKRSGSPGNQCGVSNFPGRGRLNDGCCFCSVSNRVVNL